MSPRTKLLLVVVAGLGLALEAQAAPPRRRPMNPVNPYRGRLDNQPSLNDLSMEVEALLTLHRFEMTQKQLEALRRVAPETAQRPIQRDTPEATTEYRKALMDLHAALVKGETDERIGELEEKLEEIEEASEPEVDDDVTITLAARRRVPALQAMLSDKQIEGYFEDEEEPAAPIDLLLAVLDKPGQLKGEDGLELRKEMVETIAWQTAGADAAKYQPVAVKVATWLNAVSNFNGSQSQRAEAERVAREIVGKPTPETVRANRVAHVLAELLSNPRLAAATTARLKK